VAESAAGGGVPWSDGTGVVLWAAEAVSGVGVSAGVVVGVVMAGLLGMVEAAASTMTVRDKAGVFRRAGRFRVPVEEDGG
jgi:hypothetical protein